MGKRYLKPQICIDNIIVQSAAVLELERHDRLCVAIQTRRAHFYTVYLTFSVNFCNMQPAYFSTFYVRAWVIPIKNFLDELLSYNLIRYLNGHWK